MATRTSTKKREINLDVLEAQDREAAGTPPTVKFKGKVFTLPVVMPWSMVEAYGELIADEDGEEDTKPARSITTMIKFVKAMLGDQYDDFAALQPSSANINALIEGVFKLYGTSSGESQASGTS